MFFCLDENNNKVEAFDKQGVLNAIETAIKDGSLSNLVADAAFINKIKCCVSGDTHKIAFVTQAKYNELVAAGNLENYTLYIITDDTLAVDIDEALEKLNTAVEGLETKLNDLKTDIDSKRQEVVPTAHETVSILGYTQSKITLREGKTVNDIMGLGGVAYFYDDNDNEYVVWFSVLYQNVPEGGYNTGYFTAMCEDKQEYIASALVGVENKDYIAIMKPKLTHVNDGAINVKEARISHVSIYYK